MCAADVGAACRAKLTYDTLDAAGHQNINIAMGNEWAKRAFDAIRTP